MDENPFELILTLKKRPRHLPVFGQVQKWSFIFMIILLRVLKVFWYFLDIIL